MKRIMIKASSPFTVFTATLIAEVYYPSAYKILVLSEAAYDGIDNKICELGFFDEVLFVNERDKSVGQVETTIENLINQCGKIDEYFMNTFSDCYSIMIAYKLYGKAKLHIFPEGSTTVHLETVIKLIFSRGEIVSRDPQRRSFFAKYPVDLSMFNYTWLYDLDIPQGNFKAQKKKIDVGDLLKRQDADEIIDRMNRLFRYDVTEFDICLLDSYLSEADYLCLEAEQQIIESLFYVLADKHILVKPHPPNSMIPYVKYKYQKKNVTILENADVPWELIFLNVLHKREEQMTLITFQLEGTYIMTSLAFIPEYFSLSIITLNQLEVPYMSHYYSTSYNLNYNYFISTITKNRVNLYMPKDLTELMSINTKFKEEKAERLDLSRFEITDNPYFQKVGNLLNKSTIYDDKGSFFSTAYFSFLKDENDVLFDVNKEIDLHELIWTPSVDGIFSAAHDIHVIFDDGKRSYDHVIGAGGEILFVDQGHIKLKVSQRGYCKTIRILAQLDVFKKFCKLYQTYSREKWTGEFWENWYDIVSSGKLRYFINNRTYKEIWIYGKAKIGKAIFLELNKLNVVCRFVMTSASNAEKESKDITLAELVNMCDLPDVLVITPMQDYDLIKYSLPQSFKKVAIGLSEFTDLINGDTC